MFGSVDSDSGLRGDPKLILSNFHHPIDNLDFELKNIQSPIYCKNLRKFGSDIPGRHFSGYIDIFPYDFRIDFEFLIFS